MDLQLSPNACCYQNTLRAEDRQTVTVLVVTSTLAATKANTHKCQLSKIAKKLQKAGKIRSLDIQRAMQANISAEQHLKTQEGRNTP